VKEREVAATTIKPASTANDREHVGLDVSLKQTSICVVNRLDQSCGRA
jgi:hypothetical protein